MHFLTFECFIYLINLYCTVKMNNCLLCFLIVFLIVLFFIILGFCTTNNEPFTSIAPEYKERATEIIRKQVKSFNKGSFNVALLQDYHQKNMESCAYIEINSEGDYRINYSDSLKGSDKIAYLSLLMKKERNEQKLPQCVFVQSLPIVKSNNIFASWKILHWTMKELC